MDILVDTILRKANSAPSFSEQCCITQCITLSPYPMPILSINLNSQTVRGNGKINAKSPDSILRIKGYILSLQGLAHDAFNACFMVFACLNKVWVSFGMLIVELFHALTVLRSLCSLLAFRKLFRATGDTRIIFLRKSFAPSMPHFQACQLRGSTRPPSRIGKISFQSLQLFWCKWASSCPVVATAIRIRGLMHGLYRGAYPLQAFVSLFGQAFGPRVPCLTNVCAGFRAKLRVCAPFLGGTDTRWRQFKGSATKSTSQLNMHIITCGYSFGLPIAGSSKRSRSVSGMSQFPLRPLPTRRALRKRPCWHQCLTVSRGMDLPSRSDSRLATSSVVRSNVVTSLVDTISIPREGYLVKAVT